MKILFCNASWMKHYRGIKNDRASGGGKYSDTRGYGSEMYNFLPHSDGWNYGYVQRVKDSPIATDRIADTEHTSASVKDVLVIWTAPRKGYGRVIVGWYKHAVVYRNSQDAPPKSARRWPGKGGGYCDYFIKARTKDVKLLPEDSRTFVIPPPPDSMGQSNVWYADSSGSKAKKIVKNVLGYVRQGGSLMRNKPSTAATSARQPDIIKRLLVERNAVKHVTNHYKKLGYTVRSLESEKIGWDLEASLAEYSLKLEVKGTSGDQIFAELTDNEYRNLLLHRDTYRICVVTNADHASRWEINIFSYEHEVDKWRNESGKTLVIEPRKVITARIHV